MILLDGIPISHWGLQIQKEHDHPAVSDLRSRTMAIPGMDGEWDFGSESGPKPFNFPLGFIEYDMYEKQRRLNEFVAFLFDHYGKPREMKLSFEYEPDKYYFVKLSNGFTPRRIFGFAFFDLPLIAYKPNKRFIVPSDKIVMDSDIPIMSDLLWDTGFSNRKITGPQSFEIINNGWIVIPFSFRMEGSGNDVVFKANGKTMTFQSFINKTYEVTENYTVKVDGVTNLTSTNGVFLELFPGVNKITVEGSNLDLTISESLTYQYK
ncbi:phage tail family protein [Neobacillus sp. OS1-2]|uniref:phage tail domain-containing protein n=1 Tax=Neobacillus sp. OS1-2 TaxID=3070680 RepID=UPI0027E19C08|nr:phage tail domain-containing protein [Neobacillus sp. OS1-2]WML38708.1 phage tail family protein [Neobacillus sp. OS1-2]